MEFLLLLSLGASIGAIICFIIVLTKMFQAEGAGTGLLGFICALYALYWGYKNKDKYNLQTVITIWAILIVIGIIINVIVQSASS
ncbi:MAG TPA: hypothetical protein VN843_03935 [Anaerolineales bacterium]|nr:hypothetical protein [Anaerolineales bacterium]